MNFQTHAYLWVGQLPVLQRGHVAPEPELLAVQPLHVLLPLHDLVAELRSRLWVRDHALLQVSHVLELVVRLDGLLQAEDFLLQQVQRARLAAVAREGGGAGRVDAVDPVLQLDLAPRLEPQTTGNEP